MGRTYWSGSRLSCVGKLERHDDSLDQSLGTTPFEKRRLPCWPSNCVFLLHLALGSLPPGAARRRIRVKLHTVLLSTRAAGVKHHASIHVFVASAVTVASKDCLPLVGAREILPVRFSTQSILTSKTSALDVAETFTRRLPEA